ncbi:putative pentatricopeptide repeat-containing protein At1g56570 [Punica granatum]|uniref:Uncharacterized protein n=2 Tax=Punica granatum TaxID=22663 RepID=A0A218Y129_PUNGR|nr:putative pentatricopeptide repeat-containing protein At1g56570 [Punica granatum]OWM90491.1 hypothetical protein CDL15_Pgr014794 [Punica granatum]PKI59140.1 hypothetical protein CRG98_020506 [Punica granatum]
MAVAQFSVSSVLQLSSHCRSRQTLFVDRVSYGESSACVRLSSVCRYRHRQPESSPLVRALSRDCTAVIDDVSWFAKKIEEYVHEGLFEDAVMAYVQMLDCGLPAEEFGSFPSLIKAFGAVSDVEMARQIHGQVLKLGVLDDISVANSILGMYWKCMSGDALHMFEKLPERDSVTWNTMISGFCRTGDYSRSMAVFRRMVSEVPNLYPNRVACLSVFSACASVSDLTRGREVHGYVVKTGMLHDQFLVTSLIDMYMKCGDVKRAENVFQRALSDNSFRENLVIWNAMIFGYASNENTHEALTLLFKMIDLGTKPDSSTVVAALISCSHSLHIGIGKQVHGLAYRIGLEDDVRVQTALIDMYFKCGDAEAGEKIFGTCQNSNVVMWGTVISNFAKIGFPSKALDLCHKFVREYCFADSVIVLAALRACSSLNLKQTGMGFHGLATKIGLASDVLVGSALVDIYAKCGNIKSAENVFCGLSSRDVISWNALISGYAQNEYADESLRALRDMQLENIRPNSVTVASVLSVCAQLAAMNLCKEIHGYVLRQGLESNILVSNALITTYAKCGYIDASLCIFNNMDERNQISWNSILLGLGIHGCAEETFSLFEKMKSSGVTLDHMTFTALLSACSHSGRVDKGWEYFRSLMDEYNLEPRLEQYTCMVDLLGRAGNFEQAYHLILSMPCDPDDRIWGSLLGSCKIYGDERLANIAANHIFELNSNTIGYRVLLANLYEDYDKWSEVDKVRSEIRDRGLRKTPGCSWIEVNNSTHAFSAGDCSHEKWQEIYACLGSLTADITREGYVPRSSRGCFGLDVSCG